MSNDFLVKNKWGVCCRSQNFRNFRGCSWNCWV